MESRTVRGTRIQLPAGGSDSLAPIDHLPQPGERLTRRVLLGNRWARAELAGTVITESWLTAADLSSTVFSNVTMDRCVLTGCDLVNATWDNIRLRNVVFEDCELDNSTFAGLVTLGATAFLRCSLAGTTFVSCLLTNSVFDECSFNQLNFERCDMRGADLRGNDLRSLTSVASLRGALISQDQLPALTELLVRELGIAVAD